MSSASATPGVNSENPQGASTTVDIHYTAPYKPGRNSGEAYSISDEVANDAQVKAQIAAAQAAGHSVRVVRWAKVDY